MEEYTDTSSLSVVDVYDIASEIGKEFEKLIESFGPDSIINLVPKVINALEALENLATKNERENTEVQTLRAKISQLQTDKIEKAEERQRFEKELEQIEENWKQESRDLVAMVTRLQDENSRLSTALQESRGDNQRSSKQAYTTPQEVDIVVLRHLRATIDAQRDQLRAKEREIQQKNTEIENLASRVETLSMVSRELKRKQRQAQMQARGMVEERADFLIQLQNQNRELITLRARLGIVRKENEDLSKYQSRSDSLKFDPDDPDRPRFTTAELKEILHERNELKARVSDLEDELELYRPKPETPEDEEDAPVQGPLPYEPDDAPWKKASESGIRRFFRKIFSESSGSLLGGSSPRRSLSNLSRALSGFDPNGPSLTPPLLGGPFPGPLPPL